MVMEFEGTVPAAAKGGCENKEKEEWKERGGKEAEFELVQDVHVQIRRGI